MIKGTPFTAMSRHTFGGDPRYYSMMFEMMINHLYNNFYNKISGTSLRQWIPQHVELCRHLVHQSLSRGALHETVYVDGQLADEAFIRHVFTFESWRIFGFLDDFALPTARPGVNASRRENFTHNIQRAFYSGYFRKHGLKAQVVYLPIGRGGNTQSFYVREDLKGI